VTVAAFERVEEAHSVFNFEVAGAHTYLVSELKIKSHNTCDLGPDDGPYMDWLARRWGDPDGMRDFYSEMLVDYVRRYRPYSRASLFITGRIPPAYALRGKLQGDHPAVEAVKWVYKEAKSMLGDTRLPQEVRDTVRELMPAFKKW